MTMVEERTMLDIEEVRDRLDLSDSTVRRLVREGKLRAYRIGRRLKFKPEDIDAYVERQVIAPRGRDEEAQP
jgi:excisionase family DNA binding protein